MSFNPLDWIKEGINYILYNFVYTLLYYLEAAICKALDWMQSLMDVFTGVAQVTYTPDGGKPEKAYLIDIFFHNNAITGVYLGMAAIGIALAFTFALISVIRKTFDINDKVKMSLGQIITNLFKSILFIICLNAGMTVIMSGTNTLMQQVVYVFDHAEDLAKGSNHIEYTDEQYAAMARIFNTIGNYSINQSYKNRYNINACYNEIRGDLSYLSDQGVFNFYYETKDADGNIINTWQSLLQEVANAEDFTKEVPVDSYNEGIANSLYHVMEEMRNNPNIPVLQSYDRIDDQKYESVNIGTTMFVIGTMGNGITGAAKNDKYNKEPALTDAVRAPFYRGTKSVYSLSEVNDVFDISFGKTNYIIVYVAGTVIAAKMALIIVSCVARIFNLLFLYVIAPPIFGILPLDDGGKIKQWMTAFIVQAFSIFATVISMRIYLIFLPIILSPALTLSENIIIDMVGRVVMIYAGIEAMSKANGILTGILADNAGWQSVASGDMQNYLNRSFVGRMASRVGGYVNTVPARVIGGQKFSNFVNGKANNPKAKTEGVVGFGLGMARSLWGQAKSVPGGLVNGAKNAMNGIGGGKKPPSNKGGGGGGQDAEIPPPERNIGGQ